MTVVLGHTPTPAAAPAFDVALRQAAALGEPLHVVNVVPQDSLATSRGASDNELAVLVTRAAEAGVDARALSLSGDDVVGVLDEHLRDVGATMLVIGSRRRSAVGKLLLGSTAQRLILEADCPVLVVKGTGAGRGR